MRTTIDVTDDLYRALKTRAALKGLTLREMIQGFIQQGLRSQLTPATRPADLPVAIEPTGVPIRALSRQEIREIDEMEDAGKYA